MTALRRYAALALLMALPASVPRAAEEVNLFAWTEYVPQSVLDGFTSETGIKVNYETFSSGEEMMAKLLSGASSYDVVQPPDYIAEALIKAGLLRELDLRKIPHIGNILPEFLHLPDDPEQRFTVPYMTGTVGIVVNTQVISEPIRGYRDVFQPRHKGRIVVLNDNRELVTWALYALGKSPNDLTPQNIAAAKPILADWLRLVRVFDSDSPKTSLLNGDVDLGVVWSGEAAILYQESPKFRYILPAEGTHRFVDLLAIPTEAIHVDAAHRFIDYILRADVSKRISDAFPYTNPNGAARRLLSPQQLANPASYPAVNPRDTFRSAGKASELIDEVVTDLKNSR
jgi:spermidine/putrescine transport system substrate-binding protein